jgi:hypothetical protein
MNAANCLKVSACKHAAPHTLQMESWAVRMTFSNLALMLWETSTTPVDANNQRLLQLVLVLEYHHQVQSAMDAAKSSVPALAVNVTQQ